MDSQKNFNSTVYGVLSSARTHLSVAKPNGSTCHHREGLRATICNLIDTIYVHSLEDLSFAELEKANPLYHKLALNLITKARVRYGIAV